MLPQPASEPQTTRVIGYRNPNDFPVQINLSSLGMTLTLPPKAYVVDRKGVKINDPALEKLVRPGGLTRDEGKAAIPIIFVQRPGQVEENRSQFSFAGTRNPKIDGHGKILEMPEKATSGTGSVMKNPVSGYSIEEARRLKLVNTPRDLPLATDVREDRVIRPNQSMETPQALIAHPSQQPEPMDTLGDDGYTPPDTLESVIAPIVPPAAKPAPVPTPVEPAQEPKPVAPAARTTEVPEPDKRPRRTKAEMAAVREAATKTSLPEPKV